MSYVLKLSDSSARLGTMGVKACHMIQITPNQVRSSMNSMFDVSMPTDTRALAVLAGENNGKFLFNDIEQVLPVILDFVRG